jgi:hypothetical protein
MTQRRWLARAAFVLVLAAAAVLIGFAGLGSVAMVAVGAAGACLVVAGAYWFLAHRGLVRWLAFAVLVAAPVAVLVVFAAHHLLWVGLVSAALVAAAIGVARLALRPLAAPPGMPAREVPPPKRAFVIMNPKVGRREGHQVRAEGEGRGAGGPGGAAGGPRHGGRGRSSMRRQLLRPLMVSRSHCPSAATAPRRRTLTH